MTYTFLATNEVVMNYELRSDTVEEDFISVRFPKETLKEFKNTKYDVTVSACGLLELWAVDSSGEQRLVWYIDVVDFMREDYFKKQN